MRSHFFQQVVFFLCFVFIENVYALSVGDLKIDGFGTLAAVKTDNSAVDYINAGDEWNLDTDSIPLVCSDSAVLS